MTGVVCAVAAACVLWFVPGALTGLGERRRGGGWPLAVAAAAFFPIAWGVWYLRDKRTYGVAH